ncbi:MAG TPA: permease [Anaerolineales bacterium]
MNYLLLLENTLKQVIGSFVHNWPFLLFSVLVSVTIKLYADQDNVSAFLRRNRRGSVAIATAAAVGTPLCSCGTTAVVLGMLASVMPWAPIVAFMVASPLTSPEELFYSAGLFGWPFALAFFAASILLGFLGGGAAGFAEARGWLKNQSRMAAQPLQVLAPLPDLEKPRITFKQATRELYETGRKLVVMFFIFSFIGYLLNGLIPSGWIESLFGAGRAYSVPLAATFGLPFYINTESSLPLVRAFVESGMSQGAALAFLITGAGTSIGALAGALTIARWRVLAIVIGTLWVGAILSGLVYDGLLLAGAF